MPDKFCAHRPLGQKDISKDLGKCLEYTLRSLKSSRIRSLWDVGEINYVLVT